MGAGVVGTGAALWVEAEPVDDSPESSDRSPSWPASTGPRLGSLLEKLGGRGMTGLLRDVETPGALADTVGWWPDLSVERKVELLETVDVEARLELVVAWVKEALAEIELAEQIRNDVTDGMEKNQREFLLRQQLAAIRKELGEGGPTTRTSLEEYRDKIAERVLPDDVRHGHRARDRPARAHQPAGQEHGWIRTWLDTMIELPWGERSDRPPRPRRRARRARRRPHRPRRGEGPHRRVPGRAQAARGARAGDRHRAARPVRSSPWSVLPVSARRRSASRSRAPSAASSCGSPSVACATRPRSVATGAPTSAPNPGRIVRAMTEAGTMNPVFLLDEIDKVGADWRGDPSSALLEVLDPAQNHSFRDHYLEVDLDLSDVLFIATANVLDTIPGPLLDRMEIIRLDGYTDDEKVAIARDHLLARQLERNGLRADEVVVTDDALREIVADYTREAGVRNLERQLGKVLRKAATRVAAGEPTPITVDVDDLKDALGRARFQRDERNREPAARCRERPGRDRRRWRRAVRRGHVDGRRRGPDPHRSAR